MVIDKGKLVALLVDKTGRSKQDIEEQLNQLVNRIQQTAESGRQFHIEGFGTFGMDNGALYFDPASQLKTEINQNYAGMKPIELMAAFKESGAGVPVEEIGDARESLAPEQAEETTNGESQDTIEEPEEQQKPKEEPVTEPVADPEKEAEPVPQSESQKKKPAPKLKVGPRLGKRRKSNPLGKIIMIVVILAAFLVGGWLLYDIGVLNISGSHGERGPVSTDSTEQGVNQPVPATEDTAVTPDNNMEQNAEGNVSGNKAGTSGAGAAPYGLRGAVNPETENAYTIVIHSFRLRATVEEIADSLSQKGYRTVLVEGDPPRSNWWRLGLGQFKSQESAREAVSQLPEQNQENYFIEQINS